MQKLIIKNFGPVKECELYVNDFMVFIGPQASGKSTISKGIYFFKSLKEDLLKYILEAMEKDNYEKPLGTYAKEIRRKFLKFWGPTYHLDDIFLKFDYKQDVFIEITREPERKYVKPTFSPAFESGFKSILNEAKTYAKLKKEMNFRFVSAAELLAIDIQEKTFFRKLANMVNDLFGESREVIFIPAGRSLLATLSDQIKFMNTPELDYLMEVFVEMINKNKGIFTKSLEELVTDKKKLTQDKINFEDLSIAKGIIEKILKGRYIYDKEGEKIFISKDKYVKLNYSSSGQQETIWILHLIFLLILNNKQVFIVFEEPEAHLYPMAQKQIVELISLLANLNGNQIIITTHSPYILAAINNLMYASKIGKKNFETVANRINPDLWLESSRISAYYIDNGSYESIIDEELDLIKVETIDSASKCINDEYEFLFELEDLE